MADKMNNMDMDQTYDNNNSIPELSPKDMVTPTIGMVYGEAPPSDAALDDSFDPRIDIETDSNTEAAVEAVGPDPEVNPVAEEGTPVDPVAPPTDIMNGTDLINGYNGEEEEDE